MHMICLGTHCWVQNNEYNGEIIADLSVKSWKGVMRTVPEVRNKDGKSSETCGFTWKGKHEGITTLRVLPDIKYVGQTQNFKK